MTRYYTIYGLVRGCCGHAHRTYGDGLAALSGPSSHAEMSAAFPCMEQNR